MFLFCHCKLSMGTVRIFLIGQLLRNALDILKLFVTTYWFCRTKRKQCFCLTQWALRSCIYHFIDLYLLAILMNRGRYILVIHSVSYFYTHLWTLFSEFPCDILNLFSSCIIFCFFHRHCINLPIFENISCPSPNAWCLRGRHGGITPSTAG